MTLFMETTQVEDTKTVAEIQQILAAGGARSVMVNYESGKVDALAFQLRVGGNDIPFRLPCRWPFIERALRRAGKKPRRNDTYESMARRISWRQILRWVQAQMALIETGMVKPEEVFLPYATVLTGSGERSMFEVIAERQFLAIAGPKEGDNNGA